MVDSGVTKQTEQTRLTREVGFRLRPVQVKAKLIIRREAAKFLTLWHAFPFENSI